MQQIIDIAERLTGEKVKWLFLDEIQQVRDWEVFVKAAYDMQCFRKIYITGSNSNLLANRFSFMLSGRYFANEMRPFSLKEVFAASGIKTLLDGFRNIPMLLRLTDNCVKYGMFPEIVLSKMTDNVEGQCITRFPSLLRAD